MKTFQSKKTMLIMVIVSVAVLIAVALNYRISRDVVEKTIFKHQELAAVKIAEIVDIWNSQQKKILMATVDSLPAAGIGDNEETLAPLKMAMRAGHFSDVYIGLAESGQLIDGAGWAGPPGYDPRQRPWYLHAINKGKMDFTTPYIDLVTNELVIALVYPLMRNEKLMGVMSSDTILDTLEQNVLKQQVSQNSYAFIVESEGTIIVHPNRKYVMKENIFQLEHALRDQMQGFTGPDAQSIRFNSQQNVDSILSFKNIANSSWFLCVIAPYEEARQQARQNTTIFTIELALRALGILALIVLFSITGGGIMILMLSKRYSSSLQEHEKEITGITRDLKWNIVKRKEVETYYQTLFDVANDGIIISKDFKLIECNRKTEELFGRSREELLDRTLLDLSPHYQPDGNPSGDLLAKIYEQAMQGPPFYFRWSFLRHDSSQFPASVNIKVFELGEEKLLLSSIRDISKRVDAEAQLMQAQKMAAAGEMLGMIAHQWRQPLNTLSTYISSLQAAQLNNMLSIDFINKIVNGANDQIRFMSKTIDNFRNFFKPSKKKENFNVFDVVFSAVKLVEAQIKNSDIKLAITNRSGRSTLTVFGYQSEFVHVLISIINNARDALLDSNNKPEEHQRKKIEIVVSGDDNFVCVEIIDNGPGIPDQALPFIFNPYYTTKSSKSGTGIGLYMSKMIVEKEMEGELSVESAPGLTRFSIKLRRVYEQEQGDDK